MNLQNQHDRLSRDLTRFTEKLRKARTDFEKSQIEATIRGTEMMLAALDKQTVA